MAEYGALRNRVAEAFRASHAPQLLTRPLHKSTMVATELRCDQPGFGRTQPMAREDAYLIALQFRACPNHDLFFDGHYVQPKNYRAGVTSIYDLRSHPVADIRDPYHCIMFHLPQKALDSVAIDAGSPPITALRYQPGVSVDDPVVRHLLSTLLPAMETPRAAHPLFLDHLALALTTHIAHTYGEHGLRVAPRNFGLAFWQEHRAKELMSSTLTQELSLLRLATECGLSVRQFTRAFRQSTGVSPHRWLLRYRVERARGLLRDRSLTLSEIALTCGFADQSHFSRVFKGVVGVTPGAWRRASGAPFTGPA